MKLLGLGDNTVDYYIHQGMAYPGGNAVNVAVLAKRYGHQGSYLGCLGTDERGRFLLDTLNAEAVDTSHCKVIEGVTSKCEVALVAGDRVFGESCHGVTARLNLTDEDYTYIAQHDIVHSSIYSYAEDMLADIKRSAELLSFDFSSNWTSDYLEKCAPHTDRAFLSLPGKSSADAENLAKKIYALGPNLVVITMGASGSLAYDGNVVYRQGVEQVEAVDTLGAGDAFIARFLVELDNTTIPEALSRAAASAAENCRTNGAFGRGTPIRGEDETKGLAL